MEAAIHYVVKAKLIRFIKNGEIEFIEIDQKFEDKNPIIAREQAFEFYQSYIDVLLQSLDKVYVSHRQTKADLEGFLNSQTVSKWNNFLSIKIDESLGNGIGIYFKIDNPLADDNNGDEFAIHSIEFGGGDAQSLMDGLNQEYRYYSEYGYETKEYKQVVDFVEEGEDEAEANEILKTPFDWSGYDVTITSTNEKQEGNISYTYEELIDGGESNQVEFKPCLLFYHDKEGLKSGYRMFVRHIIAKVICSFLNSNGGLLFIGVSDNKEIQGLKDDYSLVQPSHKDPKDYFLLEVDKLIRHYFKKVASNITGEFVAINGIEIFVFKVFPSKYHPVFITGLSGKEFYVRLAASCEPFGDIEDITEYCLNKWGK